MTLTTARNEVRDVGLVGLLIHPVGAGPLPAVILLGGAEGGLHERHATLLAHQGFTVLALAYYGLPGLPPTLKDIPVEYFATAVDYLDGHPAVDGGRIGVCGGSKGGEAALLVASTYPAVRAVVSVAGSGVLTQGISQDVRTGSFREIITTPVASWTYQGLELSYLPNVPTPRLFAALDAGEPIALGWAKPDLDSALVPAATIPVERINGAVLLIVGAADESYGPAFHDIAARRLAEHGHPHTWKHIVHEGAGHLIIAPPDPDNPPSQSTVTPGPGIMFRNGGIPENDARARAVTWRETLEFLKKEL